MTGKGLVDSSIAVVTHAGNLLGSPVRVRAWDVEGYGTTWFTRSYEVGYVTRRNVPWSCGAIKQLNLVMATAKPL